MTHRHTDRLAVPVTDRLDVVVDESLCIVLVLTGPEGVWRQTITNVDALHDALDQARVFAAQTADLLTEPWPPRDDKEKP